MSLESSERLYLERQVTLARAILAALALVALLETYISHSRRVSVVFLSVYLVVAVAEVLAGKYVEEVRFKIPLAADFVALAAFLYLTPSVAAFWFLFLFVVFALATHGNMRAMMVLVIAATTGIILRAAIIDRFSLQGAPHWVAIGLGTLVSGLGMGFLGARERDHLERQQFLEKVTSALQFERGLTESVRQMLGELAEEFSCEQACLAIRDEEIERLFVWRVQPEGMEVQSPETLPLIRSDTFLADVFEVSFCWEFTTSRGMGFGWDRRTGAKVREVPAPPMSTVKEFGARQLMAVTIEVGGQPAGRVILLNPAKKFRESDLRWLERIVRHVSLPLENVFLLRHLRARAVEAERSRISRDLHDGVLQTLLSLNIQLGVLRTQLPQKGEQVGEDLARPSKNRARGERGPPPHGDRFAAAARGKRGPARTDAGVCRAFSQ